MKFEKYHFHIYFESSELEDVQEIVNDLREMDNVDVGRIRDVPVGPHPVGSCQITVQRKDYTSMTEWFLIHRNRFSIFVHALSGDDLKDHTDYVVWIGDSHKLNLDFFRH